LQLYLERDAQERSDQDDAGKYREILECRHVADSADDIGTNEQF
jgi:hypothetical protein